MLIIAVSKSAFYKLVKPIFQNQEIKKWKILHFCAVFQGGEKQNKK
jgi:hypothetical protein